MKNILKSAAATLATLATASILADENKATLSLTIENDSFFGTDRYYTQGTRLQYMHRPNELPNFLGTGLTNFMTLGMNVESTRAGFSLGQELYTPSRLKPSKPILTDRPYAGWLHGSLILRRSGTFEAIPQLGVQDEFEFQAGVVGPESQAEDTQKWWHHMWGYTIPQGWRNQLKTEPEFQFYLNRAYRIGYESKNYWGVEFIPNHKLAVGTVYDYAELGATLRAGYNLPKDFVRSPLESFSTHPSDNPPSWAAYVFTGMDARGVAHNMFLDGNNFRTSQHIAKENFVADFRAGGAIRYKEVEFVLSAVHRTKEFKGQVADENFLSITTQWHF